MTISELFVQWFPLLFGLFFTVSYLVDEARKRGHLKLGRNPKKGELIGLLVLLGFHLLVAAPIILVGIVIEYTVGSIPLLELVMISVMALADLIPILLSGIIAYMIVRGIYEKWGVSLAVFLISGILSLLTLADLSGWLQPSLPFIIDIVVDFVAIQFGYLIMMIAFIFCLGKCAPTYTHTSNQEKEPSDKIGSLSTGRTLQLLVGLGRRVSVDSNEDSLNALYSIYKSNSYSKRIFDAIGRDIEFNSEKTFSNNDIQFAKQTLQFTQGRFGNLSRSIYIGVTLFLSIGLLSAISLVVLVSIEIIQGILLMMPAIILPVISLFVYQYSSRYEKGRYAPPRVSQYNSYLLTEHEFQKRVRIERFMFSLSLLVLITIAGLEFIDVVDILMVWSIIAIFVFVVAAFLSTRDRFLLARRLGDQEIIKRSLNFLGFREDQDYSDESIVEKAQPESVYKAIEIPRISPDWQQLLEARGHEDFARKITSRAREVYTEQYETILYAAIGGLLLFLGVMTHFLFSALFSMGAFMNIFSLGCFIIGLPLFLVGSCRYLKARKSTRFYGLNRKQLTFLIAHLDQRVHSSTAFGSITDTNAPVEYLRLGMVSMFMHTFIRVVMVKFKHRIPWSKEEFERVWKTRSSYPKLEGIALVITTIVWILLYQLFSSFQSLLFPDFFKLIFLGLIGYIILTAIYTIFLYYKEKGILEETHTQITDDAQDSETLSTLIDLIIAEFSLPLRVLLIGDNPKVTYTGRSYFTTTGLELREALIIPQGMVSDT
ncbi:MAG: hypothetical protein JW779_02110 [Candidatus Thorarchaeota archaeon]|nr:hypothetical protein [Candidatus Thorarchaeota archaeon]